MKKNRNKLRGRNTQHKLLNHENVFLQIRPQVLQAAYYQYIGIYIKWAIWKKIKMTKMAQEEKYTK